MFVQLATRRRYVEETIQMLQATVVEDTILGAHQEILLQVYRGGGGVRPYSGLRLPV